MCSNKLFTVIILSYNKLNFLKECIKSVLNQSYPYIEIIISDDASKNFDKHSLESFINENKNHNIINVIINHNKDNIGLVKNLNKAIKLSSGSYIMNLAGDDQIYDSEVINNIVKYFNSTNYLATTGIIRAYDENMKEPLWSNPPTEFIDFVINNKPIDIYKKLCIENFLSGPGFTYKKELLSKYGLYDEKYRLIEDYPRYLYLTRNGCAIGCLGIPLIKYRQGGISNGIPTEENFYIREMIFNDLDLINKNEIEPYINNI